MYQYLRSLLTQGLFALHGQRLVQAYLSTHAVPPPQHVIAVGKAAASMTAGAYDMFGSNIRSALVIVRDLPIPDSLRATPNCRVVVGGHPLPDERSLTAGSLLWQYIDGLPPQSEVLCLLSGGASALVEVLPANISLQDLQRVNSWLLGSGLDIGQINAVRKHLSLLKGGGLAARLRRQHVTALAISDVPADDPAILGSGPLTATAADAPTVASLPLPSWLRALLLAHSPAPAMGAAPAVSVVIIANNQLLLSAIAERAHCDGIAVTVDTQALQGDAQAAGRRLAERLLAAGEGLLVQGGETTVQLPAAPGFGGRNLTLALAAATVLAGNRDCWLLASGSDGSDGNTPYAGAWVDGQTLARGQALGMDAMDYLRRADAGTYLQRLGQVVSTGPTGTNVRDVVLGARLPEHHSPPEI